MELPYRFDVDDLLIRTTEAQSDLFVDTKNKTIEFPVGPSGAKFEVENKGKENYTLFSYKQQILGFLKSTEKKEIKLWIDYPTKITEYEVKAVSLTFKSEELKIPPSRIEEVRAILKLNTSTGGPPIALSAITKKLKKGSKLSYAEKNYLLSRPLRQFSLLPKEVQLYITSIADITLNDQPSLDSPCEMNDVRSIRLKD